MTDDKEMTDTDLEAIFDAARAHPPDVPEQLMKRVVADAATHQPGRSGWARLFDMLGGLPGLGGMATATCVGIWIGVAPPTNVPDFAGQILGFEVTTDEGLEGATLTGFGWDIEEGKSDG